MATQHPVNEEDFSAAQAVGHMLTVCMCVDCSQLLNINLKVKGGSFLIFMQGAVPCAEALPSLLPLSLAHWVIMSATVSPFLSLMCWHNIEPDCVRSHTQYICSHLKVPLAR